VKFLVDMPLPPALAQWLQAHGHDAAHAAALGLERAADGAIMQRAMADSRTIITADLDYPRLLALAEAIGPSLILFRGGDWSEAAAINRIAQVLDSLEERDIVQSILVIDRNRVRRRRLPISRPGNRIEGTHRG
jgi:predicted nuclease of predicted toxin-antitoxin system